MKRICCVCKKYLGEKEGPEDMITHGFCETCLEAYKAKMMADMDEFDPCFAKTSQGKRQDMSCVAGGEAV